MYTSVYIHTHVHVHILLHKLMSQSATVRPWIVPGPRQSEVGQLTEADVRVEKVDEPRMRHVE